MNGALASEESSGSRAPAASLVTLVLAALVLALFLFPPDCDGAFAAFDGVVYGIDAERMDFVSYHAFHPLFHVVGNQVTRALANAGVAEPGHMTVRLLAGLGAAWALLLVSRAAGRRAWLAGIGFAAALLFSRAFVINAAVGETIVPACAAALWVFAEAFRAPARPWRLWTALVFALLVRTDTVLIVPGVLAAVWLTWDPATRRRRILTGLGASATVTIAAYVAFWWIATRGEVPIWTHYFPPQVHAWTGWQGTSRLAGHVDSLSGAVVEKSWPSAETNLWLGPGFIGLQLLAALLLRGREPARPILAALAVTLLVRAAFFSWYGVGHTKWAVLTLSLVAWSCARLCRGEPRWPRPVRAAGLVLLAALAVAPPLAHARFTWRLRDRRFIGAMRHAVDEGRGCRFVAMGPNVNLALDYLTVPHSTLWHSDDVAAIVASMVREAQAFASPVLAIYERWTPWVVSGDPSMMMHPPTGRLPIDDVVAPPGFRIITWEGFAYAARFDPSAAVSRTASR